MIRTLVMSLSLALGAVTLTTACTSASAVCQAICECQHCNKYAELAICRGAEREEAQADAYECGDQFAAVLACTLEKGRCEEESARYTTRGPGTCAPRSTMQSCTVAADCFGNAPTCSNGECQDLMCSEFGRTCSTNADCVDDGPDLCEKEQEALADCIDKASAIGD